MVEYLSGGRIQGTSTLKTPSTLSKEGWVEIGRTSTVSSGMGITGMTTTDYDDLMVLHYTNPSNNCRYTLKCSDSNAYPSSGNNYSDTRVENGGSPQSTTNRAANGIISDAFSSGDAWLVGHVLNKSSQNKLFTWKWMTANSAGSQNPDLIGKTVTKSVLQNKIEKLHIESYGTLSSGELIILGLKKSGTNSSDNFWQILGSEELDADASSISVSIAKKKYLYAEIYVTNDGTVDGALTFDDDGGSNYSERKIDNQGADSVSNWTDHFNFDRQNKPNFSTIYVANVSGVEKQVLVDTVASGGTGQNDIASRYYAGKWKGNNSGQIEKFTLTKTGSGNDFKSGTRMVIWGSD